MCEPQDDPPAEYSPLLHASCSVCSSPAAPHLHYGAISCYSCRAFFRRGQPKQGRCILGGGGCAITQQNRTTCKMCRYNRCLEVGMKPDKVDATLAKRRENDARVAAAAAAKQSTARASSPGESRQIGDSPVKNTSMITGSETGFQELPRHLADRRDDWSRHMPHSSRGEPIKQWSWNIPEIGDRQVQGYMRAAVVQMESQGGMFSEPGACEGPRREHQYQMPLHNELPHFRESTHDRLRWPSPYSIPYVNTNQYLQPEFVKQELLSPNLIKCETGESGLKSENFRLKSHNSLSSYFPYSMRKSVDDAKHTPHTPEHGILPGSISTFTPTASTFNIDNQFDLGFNEEINQTIRNSFLSNQTSVIRRNEGNRTEIKNADIVFNSPDGKRSDFCVGVTQPRSERESLSVASQTDKTCVPTISANHTGVIKRCYGSSTRTQEKESDFTLNEKDVLIQPQALPELTNDRTIQPQGAPHIYIERPDHSSLFQQTKSQSSFPQDPRAVLYKLYNKNTKYVSENIQDDITADATIVSFTGQDEMTETINEPHSKSCNDGESTNRDEDTNSSIENHLRDMKHSETPKDNNPIETKYSKDIDGTVPINIAELTTDYSNSDDIVPLKKRQRMLEVPYSMGHAFDKSFLKVKFTLEEEFMIIDHIVRIEKYQDMRFDFLIQNFPNYDKLNLAFITFTQMGRKIPCNKQMERHLFTLGLEFTKQNTKQIFQEMSMLSTNVRKEVLNTTYPALYVLFFSILEGNTREKTWKDQHDKTLQITKANHDRLKGLITPLEHVRSISIKDQERFTSPWAMEFADEEKFEKTLSIIGRLLRDDKNLQALYHMLVMMTPSSSASQETQTDPELLRIQVNLCQMIYRYLAKESSSTTMKVDDITKTEIKTSPESSASVMHLSDEFTNLNPDEETRLLIGLLDDIHDCADIMQHRSLAV